MGSGKQCVSTDLRIGCHTRDLIGWRSGRNKLAKDSIVTRMGVGGKVSSNPVLWNPDGASGPSSVGQISDTENTFAFNKSVDL